MKLKRYRLIFTALAALALLATACSKIDDEENNGYNSATGKTVSVTLPIGIAEQETTVKPSTSRTTAAISTNAKLATSPEEGFTVSFGEQTTTTAPSPHAAEASATHSPATRTIAQQLTNVWVLQFNASGQNVSTTNTGTLTSGAYLTAPSLQVGTGYTIYIIANSVSGGLSIINPATLADCEAMLFTSTNDANPILSGKLTSVTVVNLGDGTGKISLADATLPMVVMRRIHAEVKLTVDFAVTGYTLTDAQLYNVPVGTPYGWNDATTTFPDNNAAANFEYTNTAGAGKSRSHFSSSGTKTTYKWFIGDNRRGNVAGITTHTDRNSSKAPAYSTFARVILTNSSATSQKIHYDIYLGSGDVKNFDVKRNHTYTLTAAIKGTADFQEALVGVDERVSGVGLPICLTDSKADSPFLISSKSMESTTTMAWGPATSISGAKDVFNGKDNTDAIMATSATNYPAAKHCRDKGSQWNLPAKAQLMLMWVYHDAIPVNDRPFTSSNSFLWSSTEDNVYTYSAWFVDFLSGRVATNDKERDVYGYVRCVREL